MGREIHTVEVLSGAKSSRFRPWTLLFEVLVFVETYISLQDLFLQLGSWLLILAGLERDFDFCSKGFWLWWQIRQKLNGSFVHKQMTLCIGAIVHMPSQNLTNGSSQQLWEVTYTSQRVWGTLSFRKVLGPLKSQQRQKSQRHLADSSHANSGKCSPLGQKSPFSMRIPKGAVVVFVRRSLREERISLPQ